MKNMIGISLCVILLLGCVIYLGASYVDQRLTLICGEDIQKELSAPDNATTATVFLRNCGATTGYITHVNLRKSDQKYQRTRSGAINDGVVFLGDGKFPIELYWTDSTNLMVSANVPTPESGLLESGAPTVEWNSVTVHIKRNE